MYIIHNISQINGPLAKFSSEAYIQLLLKIKKGRHRMHNIVLTVVGNDWLLFLHFVQAIHELKKTDKCGQLVQCILTRTGIFPLTRK